MRAAIGMWGQEIVVLLALLAAMPAVGQEADEAVRVVAQETALRNIFRIGAFRSIANGSAEGDNGPDVNDFDNATGFGLSYERKVGSLVGLDFKGERVSQTGHVSDSGEFFDEDIGITTLELDVLVHPGHAGRHVDYYLGLGLAYVYFADEFLHIPDVGAPVLRTGLDITFDAERRYGINIDVRRLYTNVDDRSDATNDYSPTRYGAAFALRF